MVINAFSAPPVFKNAGGPGGDPAVGLIAREGGRRRAGGGQGRAGKLKSPRAEELARRRSSEDSSRTEFLFVSLLNV